MKIIETGDLLVDFDFKNRVGKAKYLTNEAETPRFFYRLTKTVQKFNDGGDA